MGVSICYRFRSELELSKELEALSKSWSDEFDGEPYEDWCWFKPEKDGDLTVYEGSTSLPMDEETGMQAVMAATQLLSTLRRKVGGIDWSVNLDDMEFSWDQSGEGYAPDF